MVNALRKRYPFPIGQPVVEGLSDKQLEDVVEVMEEVHFKSGTIIAVEGDPATELFFIKSGTAEVFKKEPELDHEHHLSTLSAGDSIGEMAILDCKPRSASVRAVRIVPYSCLRMINCFPLQQPKNPSAPKSKAI